MQEQLGREHIAFYSQYDPDSEQYIYSPHGLIFSEEAVAQADGKSGLILYEILQTESKHLNKVVLIHAPISRQAIDEMRIWARGSDSSPTQQNARTSFMSNSVDGGSYIDCGDYATWVDGMGCVHDEEMIVTPEEGWIDDPFFDPESLDEEDDSGGFYPPQPDDTECEVAYGCGGGVGPGPVPEDCPVGQVEDTDGNCIEEEEDSFSIDFDFSDFDFGIDPDCNKPLSEQDLGVTERDYKIWCNSEIPSGTELSKINSALDSISNRGGICIEIAEFGEGLLSQNRFRLFPRSAWDKVGGIGGVFTNGGGPLVAIMDEIVDRFADETFIVNGTTLYGDDFSHEINLEWYIVHEIEHAMGFDDHNHVNGDPFLTPNVQQCSGLN